MIRRCGSAGVWIGPVKEREERVPLDPLRHEVDAAPVVVVKSGERGVLGEPPPNRRRKRMPAGHGSVKLAALGENRVADFLRTQAATSEGREAISRESAPAVSPWFTAPAEDC